MSSLTKSASARTNFLQRGGASSCALPLLLLLGAALACPSLRAQAAPPGAIGRLEGNDVSIDVGAGTGAATVSSSAGGYVFNGSVVTVHDGKARLTLEVGGEVDVCGPAKLTLLQSGGAITLALDFGRIHLQLLRGTSLRIFTPTIIATPLDISGETRDITAGLDMNDSLCVLATSGAIRLEQQFTGEGIIVPQAGEFFLNAGKLVPIAGTPGSCACTAMHAQSAPPPQIPLLGVSSSASLAPAPVEPAATAAQPASKAPEPAAEPNVQLRVLAQADDVHPTAPPAKDAAPPPPPDAMPEYKIIMPPLGFSASSPTPPSEPPMDAVLLVRTVHVEPEYEFTGHVEPPPMDAAERDDAAAATRQSAKNAKSVGNKKEGFWARLKRAFGGS
ncbi:MAG: hypothetical protein WB680_06575 [Candidatus Acidiferrales bacterium]